MKSSGWQWSNRKRDGDVARWWNYRTLSEFESLPNEDKLDLIALHEISWKVEAINGYEQSEEMKRNTKKPRKK